MDSKEPVKRAPRRREKTETETNFEDFTRKLLAVPKKEIDAAHEEWVKEQRKGKKVKPPA